MDMSGEYRIAAPRARVWEALNDPEILRQCIPGCEEIQKQSDTEMTAKVTAKVGPVKAKFAGKVTLSEIDAPNGYTITGEGSGGAAGFGKGGANVALVEDGAETVLNYTAHAQVGGKLAQIGSRLIDGTARKMADDFFAKFTQVVGQPEVAAAPAAEPAGTVSPEPVVEPAYASKVEAEPVVAEPIRQPPPASPVGAQQSRGLQPMIWIPLVIVAVALLLWVFT
jgi:uncharacterized protein